MKILISQRVKEFILVCCMTDRSYPFMFFAMPQKFSTLSHCLILKITIILINEVT